MPSQERNLCRTSERRHWSRPLRASRSSARSVSFRPSSISRSVDLERGWSQAFLFSELLLDASILRAAALSLRSTAPPLNGGSGATNEQKNGRVDGTAASYEERVAVTHAVGRLRHKGEVLLTDKAADGYASCSLTQDVCPAVLRIFQAQHQKEYALNVLDIQREAKPHAVLSCVGRERLEHALEHLVGESKLYSTGPGLYKLLT
eukprot:2715819-Rhodomonas_salina.1